MNHETHLTVRDKNQFRFSPLTLGVVCSASHFLQLSGEENELRALCELELLS